MSVTDITMQAITNAAHAIARTGSSAGSLLNGISVAKNNTRATPIMVNPMRLSVYSNPTGPKRAANPAASGNDLAFMVFPVIGLAAGYITALSLPSGIIT